ncbi:hypothetical protein ACJ51O_35865 (plasmid) [Burkholderia pyrrocinia]|uniref:hypothetical protein n=1 Tax=Burkholderia pyrrocinia TaxID=60550 RepID=UPI0038B49D8D
MLLRRMLSALKTLLETIDNGLLTRCSGKGEWSLVCWFDKRTKPGSNCIELSAQPLELTIGRTDKA